MSRAHRNLEEGRLTSAARELLGILAPLDDTATGQDLARSLAGLGTIYFARGDFARARRYAEEALRHDELSWSAMSCWPTDIAAPPADRA